MAKFTIVDNETGEKYDVVEVRNVKRGELILSPMATKIRPSEIDSSVPFVVVQKQKSEEEIAVEKGAKLLDENVPGWYFVGVDGWNMSDIHNCLLKKIFGDFVIGCRRLLINKGALSIDYGFDIKAEFNNNEAKQEKYDKLNKHWRTEIQKRLDEFRSKEK